ncbi:MAG: PqqD family peptide modification chaperone [Pseudomonadota bacterium]
MKYLVDDRLALVREELNRRNWQPTARGDWQLRWNLRHPPREDFATLKRGQRISCYPDSRPLTNKCVLNDTLTKARRRVASRHASNPYDFLPLGYVLPRDYDKLVVQGAREPDSIWIAKPSVLSGGRGIRLTNDAAALEPTPDTIVQRYLAAPHLLNSRKYTLRFFVLLTHLDPLVIYRYREGLVKFTTRPFTTAADSLDDHFVHLTNPDVLKNDSETPDELERISHSLYRQRLRDQGINDDALWSAIDRLIILTFMAARDPMLAYGQQQSISTERSFQLFGLDVLIDEQLKPWLLECNFSPSLDVDAEAGSRWADLERSIKTSVIRDTVSIVSAGMSAATSGQDPAEAASRFLRDELNHRGDFQRLMPGQDASGLLHCLPLPRHLDLAFADPAFVPVESADPKFVPCTAARFRIDDHLLLLAREPERLLILNAIGAFIWLSCEAGCRVSEIVEDLQAVEMDATRASSLVRDTMAGWITKGLLAPEGAAKEQLDVSRRKTGAADDRVASWTGAITRVAERRFLVLGDFNFPGDEPGSDGPDWSEPDAVGRICLKFQAEGQPGRLVFGKDDSLITVAGIIVVNSDADQTEFAGRASPAVVLSELLAAEDTKVVLQKKPIQELVRWLTDTPCYRLTASSKQAFERSLTRLVEP